LTYGAELHQRSTEPMGRLLLEWQKCTTGAGQGMRVDKLYALSGILGLEDLMAVKRVR